MLIVVCLVFSPGNISAETAQDAASKHWRPREMNPTADKMIEDVELLPGTKNCGEPQCTFDLHYFYGGKKGRKDPSLKTIIYIAGGPGDIVDRAVGKGDLWFLEGHFNVIYFDVRGSGLSVIPKSNRYDKFLRAEYIAADVEKIRQVEMRETGHDGTEIVKSWDAIYGYSYGTVVAQIYAHTYSGAVSKLILAAPIARNVHSDTGAAIRDAEGARISLLVSNLRDIYQHYRKEPCKKIQSASLSEDDKNAIKDLWSASVDGKQDKLVNGTNDLCFVDPNLAQKLENILVDLIDKYGSINFITRYYDDIVTADPTFRIIYPPREFFVAVKRLQFVGAPSESEFKTITPLHDLVFDDNTIRHQIDVALLIGYYLGSDSSSSALCDVDAQFLAPLIPSGVLGIGPPSYKAMYCQRIDAIRTSLASDGDGSQRAELVLGINDGIVRWFFTRVRNSLRSVGNGDICLSSSVTNILESPGVDEVVLAAAKRMGAHTEQPICLWDPAKYRHNVSTLLLKGRADPIIAGCQAEEFFANGLEGERALIEFPGVGHSLILPLIQDGNHDKKTLETDGPDNTRIVRQFLEASTVNTFRTDLTEAKAPKLAMLKELRAIIRTATKDEPRSIWVAVPSQSASDNECSVPN
jgi:pimeloyl-ACP methyl ester carboxylesterase